jgi:hypothetical protein
MRCQAPHLLVCGVFPYWCPLTQWVSPMGCMSLYSSLAIMSSQSIQFLGIRSCYHQL